MRRSRIVVAAAPLFALAIVPALGFVVMADRPAVASAPAKKAVDPEADRLLRQMTDYLASLQSFTVQNFAVDEKTLTTGEKIQVTSDSDIAVQRPNRLRSTQRGQGDGLGFWYDGKAMTVACKANNSYETVAAPANIDSAIDKMRETFKIDAPGADLLYSRPYEILTEQVVGGRVVGRETVQGVPANHLAFEGEDVDFQIWIKDGSDPLPLRFVITTKTVKERPQFTVQLSNWNVQPKLSDPEFAFPAPEGARSVKSIAGSCLPGNR
jgi:hypothetical protein